MQNTDFGKESDFPQDAPQVFRVRFPVQKLQYQMYRTVVLEKDRASVVIDRGQLVID